VTRGWISTAWFTGTPYGGGFSTLEFDGMDIAFVDPCTTEVLPGD
jgi:hypothetical protein